MDTQIAYTGQALPGRPWSPMGRHTETETKEAVKFTGGVYGVKRKCVTDWHS